MPPAAPSVARSREGGREARTARRRLRGAPMRPRRTLPRPLSLCLCLCLAAAAAPGAAQRGKFGLGLRLPAPSHPDPAKLK